MLVACDRLFIRVVSFFPYSFQIPDHTDNDCPLTIISCPYEKLGCETQVSFSAVWRIHIHDFSRRAIIYIF